MIYWLKKLEWRIRKSLGLTKKENKIRTIKDIRISRTLKIVLKLILWILVVMLLIIVGGMFARLWWWFFPRIIRAPMEYL